MVRPPEQAASCGRRAIVTTVVATCAIVLQIEASAQTERSSSLPTLHAVRIAQSNSGGATTVVLEADGPLPQPSSAPLDNPPRIYIDLNGVLPGRVVARGEGNPPVLRVRIASHSVTPLVTRVVIDLVKAMPYRIDMSGREQGRLVVILGASEPQTSASSPSPPARQVSPPAPSAPKASSPHESPRATPQSSASPPSSGRASAAEDAYGQRVASLLLRLHALRPVLMAIDRRTEGVVSDWDAAAKEFDAISKMLSAIKPPGSLQSTHALLLRVCSLGSRAVRLRQDMEQTTDPTASWNAASAAAGALLMLDKANSDLAGK